MTDTRDIRGELNIILYDSTDSDDIVKEQADKILALIESAAKEARIDELESALVAEPTRKDADFASQMLAVCTYVKDRLAELKGDN